MKLAEGKLSELIQICKITGDFAPIINVSRSLIKNRLNEICLFLKLSPKLNRETLFDHANRINQTLRAKFRVSPFSETLMQDLYLFEKKRERRIATKALASSGLALYFELEKINITASNGEIKRVLPGTAREKKIDLASSMINMRLEKRKQDLMNKLKTTFSGGTIQELMQLEDMKATLNHREKRKIMVSDHLSKEATYLSMKENSIGYFLISFTILLIALGMILLHEASLFSFLSEPLGNFILLFLGTGFALFGAYYVYFIKN